MYDAVTQDIAGMLTELIFQFYGAFHRHPSTHPGPKIQSHAFHILYLLSRADQKQLPVRFLLTELQMTKQQLSKLINELEELQFVERVRMGSDRRNVFIRLTADGSTYFLTGAQSVVGSIAENIQKYPAEKAEIIRDLLLQLKEPDAQTR